MESKRIEDKLKEYRARKEKERLALTWASKPFYLRILPSAVITLYEKSVGRVFFGNSDITYEESRRDEFLEEKADPSLDTTSTQTTQHYCEAPIPRLLNRKNKKTILKQASAFNSNLPETSPSPSNVIQNCADSNSIQLWVVLLLLKFFLWVILFLLAVQLEWGAVFTILSLFYTILTNLSSDKRKPGEPSAYSVFNPNCHAIDGTLKAEQLEKEIRHGF